MKKLYRIAFLALFLLANLSLWAQKADDYRAAANRGDAEAQFNLGFCYYSGYGVSQDFKQAVYWYTKSANQGYAMAQGFLGALYHDGIGVAQDYKQAVYWFTKAANQGLELAQSSLGGCYENGNGVPQDYKQAVYWYTKAANQGNAKAQRSMGDCYYLGNGVTQDFKQAVYWYTKAANQEEAFAQHGLGACYYFGRGVEKDYKQARYWWNKVLNNPKASNDLKEFTKGELTWIDAKEKPSNNNTSTSNQPTTSSTTTQPKQTSTPTQPKQTSTSTSTTSSSYSSNSSSSGKYSHWPLFYSNPVFGFHFGYAQRAMRSAGSVKDIDIENPPYLTVFGESGVMNGFQAGFFIIPSRKSMLTLNFGLNYEMYFCSGKNAQNYYREYKEINLYAPFDLTFHIPFSRRSALYVHGGLGFDYSCYNDYSSMERNEYGRNARDQFNISWECGLDLKIQGLILYSNFQKGISKHYPFGFENPMEFDKISVGIAFGF